jgi:hypothetical protein
VQKVKKLILQININILRSIIKVKKFLIIFILISTLISCQKEDMVINQYKKIIIDSTIFQDTIITKKLKLYKIVDKVSNKKEPKSKKKRFKFKEFIKSKFKKC